MKHSELSRFVQDPENLKRFQQDRLLLDVAALIYRTMKERGIKQSKLAEVLGVSKGCVSHYLSGLQNLRLRTVADIFTALGKTVLLNTEDTTIEPEEWEVLCETTWQPEKRSDRLWKTCLGNGTEPVPQDLAG